MADFSRASTARFRNHLTFGASLGALGAAMLVAASPALAQETPAPATQTTDDQTATEDQDIVVTGFRASLESAVAEKKNRDQIVESVSSEDIGKLPDASIAESIARLPGLTSQRVSGRSNVISIRGFSPDFSTTLLNGREQTSTGDNRAVEYDQYPSEVVNQVLVYKSPMASIVGQGLSGTVDLRTIRPIEFGKRVISIGARGVDADIGKLNSDSKQYGYRVNGTYVDQFFDGKVGVALAASYTDEPYQIQEFNSWGYNTINGNALIGGSKSYVTSTDLKRFGVTGTVEFKPVDNFTSTVDGFYSDFKDDQIKRGIELPLAYDGQNGLSVTDPTNNGARFDPTTATVTNGVYTNGTFTNVEGVVRNDAFQRHAKLYSFGWNNKWEGDDGWNAMFDVSHSRTDRNELVFESYSGTGYGRGNGATDTIGFTTSETGSFYSHQLDYSDPNLIGLTDPLGWGGANLQAGYYNNRIVKDRIWQYRAEVEKEIESSLLSSVKVGWNYTNHDKTLTPDESLVQIADGSQFMAIPSQYLKQPTQQAYLGLGPIVSYDPLALLNGGVLKLVSNNNNADVRAKAYGIHEDLMTMYAQANIKTSIGASELTGNFGVQAMNTSQHTDGYYADGANVVPIRKGADYWDVMPSVNLSLRFPSDFVIRAAVAREVMRPRMDDMRVAISYGPDLTGPTPIIRGSSGNPYLRPFRANAADLSFEKYFGNKGYLAAQLFYKKLVSYVIDQSIPDSPFDYSGLPLTTSGYQSTDPNGVNYVSPIGVITTPYNISGGELYGVELAGTLPFGELVSFLDGFGVTGGASYTKSKIQLSETSDPSDIPGYSKWVANGTGYFEKWGFSARGSVRYRSSFIGELSGFGANRVQRRALPETIIDAQIGYDFSSGFMNGLSVYLQAQNLTNERFATQNPGQPLQIIDYQTYGRRYLAGFTFKF